MTAQSLPWDQYPSVDGRKIVAGHEEGFVSAANVAEDTLLRTKHIAALCLQQSKVVLCQVVAWS